MLARMCFPLTEVSAPTQTLQGFANTPVCIEKHCVSRLLGPLGAELSGAERSGAELGFGSVSVELGFGWVEFESVGQKHRSTGSTISPTMGGTLILRNRASR